MVHVVSSKICSFIHNTNSSSNSLRYLMTITPYKTCITKNPNKRSRSISKLHYSTCKTTCKVYRASRIKGNSSWMINFRTTISICCISSAFCVFLVGFKLFAMSSYSSLMVFLTYKITLTMTSIITHRVKSSQALCESFSYIKTTCNITHDIRCFLRTSKSSNFSSKPCYAS